MPSHGGLILHGTTILWYSRGSGLLWLILYYELQLLKLLDESLGEFLMQVRLVYYLLVILRLEIKHINDIFLCERFLEDDELE